MAAAEQFEVEIKTLEPLLVAGLRMQGHYQDCGKGFRQLGMQLGRYTKGPPLTLIYDSEPKDGDADFEPCMPLRAKVHSEQFDIRELEAGEFLCLRHRGPYSELGRSYEKLIRHAEGNGYRLKRPVREVYLKGPGMIFRGNPRKYLTEIQIRIKREDD